VTPREAPGEFFPVKIRRSILKIGRGFFVRNFFARAKKIFVFVKNSDFVLLYFLPDPM